MQKRLGLMVLMVGGVLSLLVGIAFPTPAPSRRALVIGNAAYPNSPLNKSGQRCDGPGGSATSGWALTWRCTRNADRPTMEKGRRVSLHAGCPLAVRACSSTPGMPRSSMMG